MSLDQSPTDVWTIYCHTNRITSKKYVGQTVRTMPERWDEHVKNAGHERRGCRALSAAIKKYGADAFGHEILDIAPSRKKANSAERAWIKRLKTLSPHGYNLATGGGVRGFSKETRRLQSEAAMRREARMTLEQKSARVTNGTTPEQRSETKRRMWANLTPEQREARVANVSAALVASTKNTEAIRRQWATMTPEQKSARSAKVHDAQTPEQRSARGRKAWASIPPEVRTRIISAAVAGRRKSREAAANA